MLLTILLALALPATALMVAHPGWFGAGAGGSGGLPDRLREQAAAAAVPVLQADPQIAHLGHDHDSTGPLRVLCIVDPFGVDPPGATALAQVTWVYAQHLCVIGEPGLAWDYAAKSAGPVAIGLTNPPTVRLPVAQQDYRTQVRQMIPPRYQAQAFGTFAHPELVAQLRQRYTDQVAKAPS